MGNLIMLEKSGSLAFSTYLHELLLARFFFKIKKLQNLFLVPSMLTNGNAKAIVRDTGSQLASAINWPHLTLVCDAAFLFNRFLSFSLSFSLALSISHCFSPPSQGILKMQYLNFVSGKASALGPI